MLCPPGAYEMNLKACPDSIKLRAGLEPNQDYYWIVANQFGQETIREAVTSGAGEMTIPMLPFPAGNFNEHAGAFKLKIQDRNHFPVKLFFSGNEYNSVYITFQKIDDPSGYQHNIIQ